MKTSHFLLFCLVDSSVHPVQFSENGFSRLTMNVKKNDSIVFKNTSKNPIVIAQTELTKCNPIEPKFISETLLERQNYFISFRIPGVYYFTDLTKCIEGNEQFRIIVAAVDSPSNKFKLLKDSILNPMDLQIGSDFIFSRSNSNLMVSSSSIMQFERWNFAYFGLFLL
jgi:hypothetical protein